MKIYQVGGAVRDKILGIMPKDIDYVVVGATLEEMLLLGFVQVGKKFPVFINPKTKAEYALARKEIKTGEKHTDFEFIFTPEITLQEDLQRRDFTCNAIAYDEENDELFDYNGGLSDIQNKILRHVNAEHFVEDPLRVLRMCRFAAQLNFEIDEKTIELTQKMVQNKMLENLSAERIWKEFEKALKTNHFEKFISTSFRCGAFEVLFPEISQYNFEFLLKAEHLSEKVKFALFLSVAKTDEIVKNICNRLRVPNVYKKFALLAHKYQNALSFLSKANLPELIDFVDDVTKGRNFEEMESLFEIIFFPKNASTVESDIGIGSIKGYIRQIYNALSNIKASDMPNFDSLKNSKEIKDLCRVYKIQEVVKRISK